VMESYECEIDGKEYQVGARAYILVDSPHAWLQHTVMNRAR
jgi:hypothetical protein